MGIVGLGAGREGELGDCARAKNEAVSRATVLDVADLLALLRWYPGVKSGLIMQEETPDMPTGTNAISPRTGSSASMRMIARTATCARYDCEFVGSVASLPSESASEQ
jgi:hypothetical protein